MKVVLSAALSALSVVSVSGIPSRAIAGDCDEYNPACLTFCNPQTQTCCYGPGPLAICTSLCGVVTCPPSSNPPTSDMSGTMVSKPPVNGCNVANQSCPHVSYVAGATTAKGTPPDFLRLAPPLIANATTQVGSGTTPVTIPAPVASAGVIAQQGPPRAPGVTRVTAGDPVDVASGEFILSETDLAFPGYGPAFELVRTYRSRITYEGPLGPAWDHAYNQRITSLRGLLDEVILNDGHGSPLGFVRTAVTSTKSASPNLSKSCEA
jgi:hypothetical protein